MTATPKLTKRKPKGWTHRYEIIERDTTITTEYGDRTFVAFHIIKFMGRKQGSSSYGYFRPHKEITDADLIRRSGIGVVTVPIYVVRKESQK